MRMLLGLCLFVPLATLRCESPANKSAASSPPEFAIAAVTVELDVSVEVTDADTGAPIGGATVELVRSGIGKELAPPEARNTSHTATTNDHGVAHLDIVFGGHWAPGAWVMALTGNSYLAVKVPKYVASRAFVCMPFGRLDTGVKYLDRLTFRGDETRQKLSYHVRLHRDPNA